MYGDREDEEKSEGQNRYNHNRVHIKIEFPAKRKYQQGDSPILLNIEITIKIYPNLS